MRAVFVLLAIAGWFLIAGIFCTIAAGVQKAGDQHYADIIGFSGIGLATGLFLAALVVIFSRKWEA